MRQPSRARVRPVGMQRRWILAVALAIVTASCGASDDGTGAPTSTASISETTVPPATSAPSSPTSVPSATVGPVELTDPQPPPRDLDEATRQATADLAARTAVAPDEIQVSFAGEVTWNDGSLGCPEPGKLYTQSLVPGWRVVLTIAGDEFAYHGARGRALFYCPSPSEGSSADL